VIIVTNYNDRLISLITNENNAKKISPAALLSTPLLFPPILGGSGEDFTTSLHFTSLEIGELR